MKKRATNFTKLLSFLEKVPGIEGPIGSGTFHNGNWWIKFVIDVKHPLAWRVVQELGFVLNYLSLEERLPTVFMPVSPPPYLNGGEEFLSWVIESTSPKFTPAQAARWLEDSAVTCTSHPEVATMTPNKCIKFAPCGRPTRKVQSTLLGAYARR